MSHHESPDRPFVAGPQSPGGASSVSPSLIAELLVQSALGSSEPVTKLTELYDSARFRELKDKFILINALADVEGRALSELQESEDLGPELAGCLEHSGELFDRLLDSLKKCERSDSEHGAFVTQHLEVVSAAWSEVLISELGYLTKCQEWSEADILLLQHSCDLFTTLPYFWDGELRCEMPSGVREGVTSLTLQILRGKPFNALFQRSDSPEVTKTIHRVFYQAGALEDEMLTDARLSFLSAIYGVCRMLNPEEFALQAEEAEDEAEESDSVGDGQGWNILEPGDSGYEQLAFDEACEASLSEVVTDWSEILRECLLAARVPGRFAAFIPDFLEILDQSPFGMDFYRETLDALVFASEDAVKQFLPSLVSRSLDDFMAVVQLVSLAEFHNRVFDVQLTDPRLHIVAELRKLSRGDRSEILRRANYAIETFEKLFDDVHKARATMHELRKELKRPVK